MEKINIKKSVILASSSPRRSELLSAAGVDFTVDAADIDENIAITDPATLVEELSRRKAHAVCDRHPGCIIIGADTVVAYDDMILGKPKDEEDAVRMLKELSGRTHSVLTGVTLICTDDAGGVMKETTFHESTSVTFHSLGTEQIREYVATGEPMDKAGSYAIQGKGAALIASIDGDYENVVGLPVKRLLDTLLTNYL